MVTVPDDMKTMVLFIVILSVVAGLAGTLYYFAAVHPGPGKNPAASGTGGSCQENCLNQLYGFCNRCGESKDPGCFAVCRKRMSSCLDSCGG